MLMDGQTYGRTDRPSYRDARTHLKEGKREAREKKLTNSITSIDVPNPERSISTARHDGGLVDVHAADSRRVSVQRVNALARLRVPHFERAIRGAGNDDVFLHLRRPDAARVTHQSAQAFTRLRRPHLE